MISKILVALACTAALVFAAEDPVAVVKKKDVELQTLLKKSSHSEKEMERINTLLK